jgi:hypothetical protein
MVRLWSKPNGDAGWHSEVEHVQSGQRWTFKRLGDLLDFLHQQSEDRTGVEAMTDHEKSSRREAK